MNAKQNYFQNALQNAHALQNFTYQEIGNQTSTFMVLILALILLFAYFRSENRTRKLMEELIKIKAREN